MATAPNSATSANVGPSDRAFRISLGLLILVLGLLLETWWGLVGLVPLVTGATGFCPLYRLVGVNTCRLR